MNERSSQRPSARTTSREIEPLSACTKANGRLSVACRQSSPMTAPCSDRDRRPRRGRSRRRSARPRRRTRRPRSTPSDSPPGIASQRSSLKTCWMIGSSRAARIRYSPPSNSRRGRPREVAQHLRLDPGRLGSGAAVCACAAASRRTAARIALVAAGRSATARAWAQPGLGSARVRSGRRPAGSCPRPPPPRRRGARGSPRSPPAAARTGAAEASRSLTRTAGSRRDEDLQRAVLLIWVSNASATSSSACRVMSGSALRAPARQQRDGLAEVVARVGDAALQADLLLHERRRVERRAGRRRGRARRSCPRP